MGTDRAYGRGQKPCVRAVGWLREGRHMTTATLELTMEPMGLVVQDGGEEHRHPRIIAYFWAAEEETDEEERH
jgi:hypothetical protein